jgi:capsular exopolysaccharide synthesis family protein
MSRIFEALQQASAETARMDAVAVPLSPAVPVPAAAPLSPAPVAEPSSVRPAPSPLDEVPCFDVRSGREHRLVSLSDEHSVGAEKWRVLCARLRQRSKQTPLKKLVVTSAVKGDGKSTVSTNLAITFARRTGQKVLLMDGDLRHPNTANLLGVSESPGIADWWRGQSIYQCLRRATGLSLWLLSAGRGSEQPLEILQSARTAEMLTQASAWFDWVIIDSPPLVPLVDATVWATLAHGTLLVVRQDKTPQRMLIKALESVEKSKLLGIVLNESTESDQLYYQPYSPKPPDAEQ